MLALLFMTLWFLQTFAAAGTHVSVISPTENLPVRALGDPGEFIASIIKYAIGLTGVLALIAITWWGIVMISGAGSEEHMKKWRKMIIYALVGVLFAGAAFVIVNLVANINVS